MSELYEQLKQYGNSDIYPYHMPGHKRHAWGLLPKEITEIDITEIDGFDNLHQAEGILQELQEKAAVLYGAEKSFYLINGSSCGILAAVSAALPAGGHLLMARNCHKSAYHAAYLRNLTISYLYPALMEAYDICDVITPEQVKVVLEQESDIGAVLLVSPTYEGRIADVKAIAEIVHEKGIPLIVDEAHGAHLGLARGQRSNSCQLGADIVIHSVHKTLHAMTQTALLHVNGQRINRDKLRRFLHIYQSSSPSYVLMASIDNALAVMAGQGQELFETQRESFTDMLETLKACKYLRFLPLDEKQDIGKLVISSQKTGLSGQQIYDMLLQEYHLQLEMAAGSYCLAMFTVGDTSEAYERMTSALLSVDETIGNGRLLGVSVESVGIEDVDIGSTDIESVGNESSDVEECEIVDIEVLDQTRQEQKRKETERTSRAETQDENIVANVRYNEASENRFGKKGKKYPPTIPLAQAWDMEYELVPLKEAIGRFVGDFINLYPPGVPLLVPGEVLQETQLHQLKQYLQQGLNVQGVGTEAPHWVKVLKDT